MKWNQGEDPNLERRRMGGSELEARKRLLKKR